MSNRANEFIKIDNIDEEIMGAVDLQLNLLDLRNVPTLHEQALGWANCFNPTTIEGATYTAIEPDFTSMKLKVELLPDRCGDDEERNTVFECFIVELGHWQIGHAIQTIAEKQQLVDGKGENHSVTIHLVVTDYYKHEVDELIRNMMVVIEPDEMLIL